MASAQNTHVGPAHLIERRADPAPEGDLHAELSAGDARAVLFLRRVFHRVAAGRRADPPPRLPEGRRLGPPDRGGRLPRIGHAEGDTAAASGSALAYRHLVLGAVAIFLYVGGEVSIGSFLVNFLGEQRVAGMPAGQAAGYVSVSTIFSMALHGLGRHTGQGSGILCMAIVGGAIVPFVQGGLADRIGVQPSFFVPAACHAFILFFGLRYANLHRA
jgi:hypothetical protein